MEIVYIDKDFKVYGVHLRDDEMPVDYLAAWISPDEYETLSEQQIRHMWMTLWIEAAAVGADPDSLTIEVKGSMWNGPGGISTAMRHVNLYLEAIGLRLIGWGPNRTRIYEMRWKGLPKSETFTVESVRYGVMGALARFAWQDPGGWLAHASDIAPGRIYVGMTSVFGFSAAQTSLKDVSWWPPGEAMNEQFWSRQDAMFTESQPRRDREKPTDKERWMADELVRAVEQDKATMATMKKLMEKRERGAHAGLVLEGDFKVLPKGLEPVHTFIDEAVGEDYTAVAEARMGEDKTIYVDCVRFSKPHLDIVATQEEADSRRFFKDQQRVANEEREQTGYPGARREEEDSTK